MKVIKLSFRVVVSKCPAYRVHKGEEGIPIPYYIHLQGFPT